MKTKNLVGSYDESEIYNGQVAYLMESETCEETKELYTREEAEKEVEGDIYIYDEAADNLYYNMEETKAMAKNNEFWLVEGTNMGWQNRSGYKYVKTDNAKELLQAILPDTNCTIYVYEHYKGFKIKISHHDSPMGEWYIVKPIKEAEYYKNN